MCVRHRSTAKVFTFNSIYYIMEINVLLDLITYRRGHMCLLNVPSALVRIARQRSGAEP